MIDVEKENVKMFYQDLEIPRNSQVILLGGVIFNNVFSLLFTSVGRHRLAHFEYLQSLSANFIFIND